ncbi:protoporphyrinogen oxidase [Deferrisoma camini]|uniref:protoporphyrinogen oxidase n=1 Tax=Deferrisoma camini TaxID=1035120 RepID=UPI00046C93F4|nr:protoporphyrinogen oxidase [Deferrisoma camini]
MKRVVVVGGGLSGLSAAWWVAQSAREAGVGVALTVLEREPQAGGKIRSSRKGGYLCEAGPNGFLDNKPSTIVLSRALGLGERLLRSRDEARKRFVFAGGRLRQLPEDPVSFLASDILSIRGKLRLAAEFLLPQGDPDEDESVAAFVRRRLGEEALDRLIDPMAAGIYAGDPETMSLRSSFPKVHQLEQRFGGLLRGMLEMRKMAAAAGAQGPQSAGPGGVLWSYPEGLEELVASLADGVGRERVRTGVAAEGMERVGRAWVVRTSDGEAVEADAVVLAVPAYDGARLLGPLDDRLADLLHAVPYVPAAVVCTGYPREGVPHPLDGFGFLVPKSEGRRILGSLWSSSIFARRSPDGRVLLTQIVGGARNPELVGLDDAGLVAVVREELRITLGIEAEPEFVWIRRWDKAIPQYVVGHGDRLQEIEERVASLGGVFLAGNAFYGIGVNDCTARAQELGPQVVAWLAGAP